MQYLLFEEDVPVVFGWVSIGSELFLSHVELHTVPNLPFSDLVADCNIHSWDSTCDILGDLVLV